MHYRVSCVIDLDCANRRLSEVAMLASARQSGQLSQLLDQSIQRARELNGGLCELLGLDTWPRIEVTPATMEESQELCLTTLVSMADCIGPVESRLRGIEWYPLYNCLGILKCRDEDIEQIIYGHPIELLEQNARPDGGANNDQRLLLFDMGYEHLGWLDGHEVDQLHTVLKDCESSLFELASLDRITDDDSARIGDYKRFLIPTYQKVLWSLARARAAGPNYGLLNSVVRYA